MTVGIWLNVTVTIGILGDQNNMVAKTVGKTPKLGRYKLYLPKFCITMYFFEVYTSHFGFGVF
jgi:hypothetical protein